VVKIARSCGGQASCVEIGPDVPLVNPETATGPDYADLIKSRVVLFSRR
jgi:hypothetical protein